MTSDFHVPELHGLREAWLTNHKVQLLFQKFSIYMTKKELLENEYFKYMKDDDELVLCMGDANVFYPFKGEITHENGFFNGNVRVADINGEFHECFALHVEIPKVDLVFTSKDICDIIYNNFVPKRALKDATRKVEEDNSPRLPYGVMSGSPL